MRANPSDETVFVSCAPGLEGPLGAEARALGGEVTRTEGGVELRGRAGLHRAANLRLRTAGRVLLRIARFEASDARALERGLRQVELSRWRWAGASVALGSSVQRVRWRGVAEVAARALGLPSPPPRPSEDRAALELALHLRVVASAVELSVDTSGEPLYRRGYRQEVSMAPLRETLAAGILALAGPRPDEAVIDPMCGSGTFLIERAWEALRRAPGSLRGFGFERFPCHDARAWALERSQAKAEELAGPPPAVLGFDLHAGALGTARRNARRAGVTLALERADATRLDPPRGVASGLVVANLPYGKRVGEREQLVALYRAFGENLRLRWRGFRTALLIPDEDRLAALLPAERVVPLSNGGLRCRLLLGKV